jgi:hypothetical protein
MDKNINLTPDGVLLKSRFDKIVAKCGGVKRAEDLTRVGQRVLYDYANPLRSDVFAPVDIVADLEKACGENLVTQGLALIGGGYFVKPTAAQQTRVAFGRVMPSVGKDIGDLMRDAFAATEGKLSEQDAVKLRDDIQRTMSDLALALGVLDGGVT